jgi:hypothetical protein
VAGLWLAAKLLGLAALALLSLQLLYLAVDKYRGQGPGWAMVLVVVPAATYLWWLMGWLLKFLGVRRGPAISLLLSLTLTIWLLAGVVHLRLGEHWMGASEGLWRWVELAAGYLFKWLPG